MSISVSILIVDDEPDVADLFRQRFRRETRAGTYVLHFAASGEEALDRLTGEIKPQLIVILSDINMPGMDGLELLRVLKPATDKIELPLPNLGQIARPALDVRQGGKESSPDRSATGLLCNHLCAARRCPRCDSRPSAELLLPAFPRTIGTAPLDREPRRHRMPLSLQPRNRREPRTVPTGLRGGRPAPRLVRSTYVPGQAMPWCPAPHGPWRASTRSQARAGA